MAAAAGGIAAELVARAPKDGYTLLLGSGSTLITGPALYTDRSYDPIRDFAPVSLAERPHIYWCRIRRCRPDRSAN